ncbi:DUF4192 family protein [Isoptericola croceus]|uniref:DUF4192 family protein n=1 Tax=Isoptericola croceus TaxID=3031406 RepID=UPI0023F70B90|nr:DUF4192 family protein [Isoptericola croceus]
MNTDYDVREILALIPFQLGFWPADSIVVAVVESEPTGHHVRSVRRTDLHGPVLDPGIAESIATEMTPSQDGDSVLVALYTGDTGQARRIVERLRSSLRVAVAVQVRATDWFDLDVSEPVASPLGELQHTRVHARMVLHDKTFTGSREQSMPYLASPDARRAAARGAAEHTPGPGDVADLIAAVASPVSDPVELGRAAAVMGTDGVVVRLLTELSDAPGQPSSLLEVVDHLLAMSTPEPDERARAVETLARDAAAHAPLEMRAGALVTAAVLGWWSADDVAMAQMHASAALTVTSSPQARTAADLLSAGLAPGWVVSANIARIAGE